MITHTDLPWQASPYDPRTLGHLRPGAGAGLPLFQPVLLLVERGAETDGNRRLVLALPELLAELRTARGALAAAADELVGLAKAAGEASPLSAEVRLLLRTADVLRYREIAAANLLAGLGG